MLGGQPGAGKSSIENMINMKNEFASISSDDYRKYHPSFDKFNNIWCHLNLTYYCIYVNIIL